jgi:O-antigen/teichoic acid export membrane protein
VASIGGPALISQYCLAAGTVILGLAGRTPAAASLAVGVRLLSGLQGLQGAVAAAAFPRLARGGASVRRGRDERVNRRTLAVIVLSSGAALAVAALAARPLTRLLLVHGGRRDELVMLLALSAATASGTTLQLSFALVARHLERRIVSASLCGAGAITAGAILAAVAAGRRDAALVAAASFVAGQLLTAAMLTIAALRPGLIPRRVAISALGAAGVAVGVAILAHSFAVPAAAIGLTAALAAAAVAWRPPRRGSSMPSAPIGRDLQAE